MTEKKQLKYDKAYLKMALEWGKLSHCKRKQVGALIVKDRMIISDGFNGRSPILLLDRWQTWPRNHTFKISIGMAIGCLRDTEQ